MIHSYILRAENPADFVALLEAAQAGKPRPFVTSRDGEPVYDASRIVFPRAEMTDGEPVYDEAFDTWMTPQVTTGFWLCEVRLTEPDAELAAISI